MTASRPRAATPLRGAAESFKPHDGASDDTDEPQPVLEVGAITRDDGSMVADVGGLEFARASPPMAPPPFRPHVVAAAVLLRSRASRTLWERRPEP